MEGYPLGDFNRLEPGSGRVRGLTEEESLCLEELQRLERKTWSHLEHVADDGTRIYAPDPPQIEKERQRIKQRYPDIIASLVHETTEEIYSTESIRLGRRQPPIFLGERARLLDRRAIPSVFPILVVFAALAGTRLNSRLAGKVVIGVVALAASLAMTASYHSGYSDFRSDKMTKPLSGDVIRSAPTLLTLNPIGAPIAHAALHTSAVLHS